MPRSSDRRVETPLGPARVVTATAAAARATLVLGHGAGGGIGARDLAALAAVLPGDGIAVVRVEQPWKVARRKVAAPPRQLDIAWGAVLTSLDLDGPLIVGGRSAGARVACRTAAAVGAVACLALAFPLHPPGRPEKSRVEELVEAGVPTLVVQGERDAFGAPSEFPAGVALRPVPYADHGFAVPKSAPVTQDEALSVLVEAVTEWLPGVAAGIG
jgi:predicted alpha/beta-hydrolase family hydrolase